jgi:leucyl-tRNA synthetase
MKNNEIKKAIDIAFFTFLNDINWYKKRKGGYSANVLKIWLKLLAPFIPHICEELWSKFNKTSISQESWPEFSEEHINIKIEAGEELIKRLISDIEEIKKLSKIRKPVKITLFVAPPWKYHVYNAVLEKKELKEVLHELGKTSEDIINYYKKLKKRKSLKDIFLTSGMEWNVLNDAKEFLKRLYNCEIEIIKAEESEHLKASVAEPEKPGILIE